MQVWTDKEEQTMYYISPVWFIPAAVIDWFNELEFIRDFHTPLHPTQISSRWMDAYKAFNEFSAYWRTANNDLVEYD